MRISDWSSDVCSSDLAYEMASGYFADWLGKVDDAIEIADFCIEKQKHNDAAFTLHQAAERAYTCFLLVRSQYVPRSHNLKFLRSLAEDREPRLVEIGRAHV